MTIYKKVQGQKSSSHSVISTSLITNNEIKPFCPGLPYIYIWGWAISASNKFNVTLIAVSNNDWSMLRLIGQNSWKSVAEIMDSGKVAKGHPRILLPPILVYRMVRTASHTDGRITHRASPQKCDSYFASSMREAKTLPRCVYTRGNDLGKVKFISSITW